MFAPSRIIIIILLLVIPLNMAFSGQAEDFTLSSPPQAALEKSDHVNIFGRQVETADYLSASPANAIASYYTVILSEQGFKNTKDSEMAEGIRMMRFRREDVVNQQALVIDIVLSPGTGLNTQVGTAKYSQPIDSLDIEKTQVSLKDPMFSLPKEDSPGSDIAFVPRPPQGVRLANFGDKEAKNYVMYSCGLPVEKAREFYLNNMPAKGWALKNEVPVGQAEQAFKLTRAGKKKYDSLPIAEFADLDSIISRAYVLNFENEKYTAKITIFPGLSDTENSSIVQIAYEK